MPTPAKQRAKTVGQRARVRARARNRRVRTLRSRLPDAGVVGRALARGGRRALPALIGLFGIAVVTGAGWLGYTWLTTSDRFAIESIEVRGTERLDDDYVRSISGAAIGDNLFRTNLSTVERVTAADPWIRTVHAKRRLPNQLIIEVVEREAAAIVSLGNLYLADDDGRVFKNAAIAIGEGKGLPVITGIDREHYLNDEPTAQAAIRTALSIAREYSSTDDRPTLGEVHLDARDGITLITYETALAVRLGGTRDEDLASRLSTFDSAWSALNADERLAARVVYMDNETNPDRITVRFGGQN